MKKVYAQVGSSFQQIGGSCPEGFIEMVSERPSDGDYIAAQGGSWVIAPIPVPEQISLAQGHHILIVKGKYQQVLDYIDAIPDPLQKLLAENAFYRTNPWNRQSPFLNQAAIDLDFIDDLDDWFIEASKVII